MDKYIGLALVVGGWLAFTWFVIRADRKAEESYNIWYNDPSQIWNQWKE